MKAPRFRLLFAASLLLAVGAACQAAPIPAETASAPVVEFRPVSAAEPTLVPVAEPTSVPPDEPVFASIDEGWDDSLPQQGDPLPRPGDTLVAWDLSRAGMFPSDADCTAEQLLEKWLSVEGIVSADLDARGCTQLVLAAAMDGSPFRTTTVCYEKLPSGVWQQAASLPRMQGTCGKSGVNHDRVQGDLSSPGGLWKLGTAFGNEEKPEGIRMPWRDITPYSDWVDDNDSIYFNTWQERNDPNLSDTWDAAEHLADYPSAYALACVIRFNMPPYAERGKGSAIFFHCSEGATAGCVGLGRMDFERVLLWLDPTQNPYILITGYGM